MSIFIINKSDVPFSIWRILTEIELRGKWVTVSAQLEFLLSKIVIYSNNKLSPKNGVRQFDEPPFWKKIDWAKKDLKLAYPELHSQLVEDFKKIKRLKNVRNQIAHGSFLFDEKESDKSFVIIQSIVWKNGKNQMEQIRYELEYLDGEYKAFKEATKNMINTWIHLVNDFGKDDPNFSVLSNI